MNKRQRKKAAKRRAEKERQQIAEKANTDFQRAMQSLYEACMEVAQRIGEALVEAANAVNAEFNKQQKQG